MFHAKNRFFNLILSKRCSQKVIFALNDLRDIRSLILKQAERIHLRFTKKLFVELCDVWFQILLSFYFPIFIIKRENSFLPMFAISNHLEVSSVVVSEHNIFDLGTLV